jgi:PAS domain S-box-containing protein
VRGVEARDGVFWIATEAGLARLDRGGIDASLNLLIPAAARELRGIALAVGTAEDEPTLWLAGVRRIDRLQRGVWSSVVALPEALAGQTGPLRLLVAGDGAVMVGGSRTVFRIEPARGTSERLDLLSGLPTLRANAFLRDREGLVWIAGDRGLSRLVSRRFATYRRRHGLLESEVSAIAEASPGVLVLGHNDGLSVLAGTKLRTIAFPPLAGGWMTSQRVQDLEPDGHGGVWVAATDRGLGHLTAGGELQWPLPDLPSGDVVTVRLAADTLFLAGRQGLFRLVGSRVLPATAEPFATLRRLVRRSDGSLLLLTAGRGVWSWDPRDGVRRLTPPTPGPGENVFAAWEEAPGKVWIGSRDGVLILRDGQLVPPPAALRAQRPVYAITGDRTGNVWLGSDGDLTRWDGRVAKVYTPADGLAGWESNRAALMVDSDGNLWSGSEAGVSRYQPDADVSASLPPLVAVETIEAEGRTWPANVPLTLAHGAHELAFSWRASSYLDEDRMRFRTRLDDVDHGWSRDLGARERSIRFFDLPPGRYRLRLRAANAAGIWSAPVASAEVTILPPWWRTWWFVVIALLTVGGAGALGVRSVVRWRYARRLEVEVGLRTSELAESEARYRRLFEDDAAVRLLLDPRSRTVVQANHAAASLLGVPVDFLPGTDISVLALPGLERMLTVDPARRPGETLQGTLHMSSGEERALEMWVAPLVLQGAPLLLLTARDVTERRHLQEQRIRTDKLESLGVLAGGLAHDFNNILAAALGNISLAGRRLPRDHTAQPFLEGAEASLLRAQRLTGQLLGFARGGAPLRRLAELGPLLEESARFVLAGSPSALRLELAEDLWPAEVDEGQLSQAIGNLVLNADQAMPGGGEITLRASNLTLSEGSSLPLPPGPYVRLAVSDRGPGIPVEQRARVFDPYFTTKSNGTGLGLTSVHAIVSRHGGHVEVEEGGRSGATFAAYLPARPGGCVESAVGPPPRSRSGNGRILVMDDEADLRRLYKDVLTELGYAVEAVADGEAAIRSFQQAIAAGRPFACVIMDLTIPGGMGGREAVARLRELDPDVRAIVASGYSTDDALAGYTQAGFVAALTKPFTISALEQTLARVLGDPGAPPAR